MPIRLAQARLSEGRAIHQVTTKKKGGKFETANKTVEGPVSFIATPTLENIEKQIESRIISVCPDDSSNQTRKILSIASSGECGHPKSSDF